MSAILFHGDCLEEMKKIQDGSVDMVLTDPPYGLTQQPWDNVIPFEPLWEQLNRICKRNAAVVLHCMQPFTTMLIASNIKNFKYCWVWNKHYCRGFLNAKRQPLREHEDIAVFYRNQCTYNPRMTKGKMRQKANSCKQNGNYGNYKALKYRNDNYYPKSILSIPGVAVSNLTHPTEKPVELERYLIETYTNPGETVLDCCMGTGATGVASVLAERNFIGIEKDENYFLKAKERISNV